MLSAGIDIGGTKINIGILDEKKLLCEKKLLVADVTDLSAGVSDCLHALCAEHCIEYNQIVSCGVGIPGTVSDDGKHILKAPNIQLFTEDFADRLQSVLGIPVVMIQDSRAAAYGEYSAGAGKNRNCVVCVTLGTGIGTGIVIDGRIYNGALGAAGELGHLPVQENGRPCGCEKNGCLEKYAAGLGLDMTAKELLGQEKKASDLFSQAESGNEMACKAIEDAVNLLGRSLVSIVNLLSPDCLLFSGGLSNNTELYLNPLIEYIRTHCYQASALPFIGKAELGENAPLYGAALFAATYLPSKLYQNKRKPLLSASIMCADFLNLGADLSKLESAGVEYIHCDIMDNVFVPNLMLPPEFCTKIRAGTKLPFDYHIMCEHPETIIDKLDIRNGDFVSIHYESTNHLERVISLVKSKGAYAAVALNPATPIEMLSEILSELDMVLLMTVNPGFAGQKLVPGALDKISHMQANLKERGLERILIEVDGNCSFENIPKMHHNGADMFVVGTSSLFAKGFTFNESVEKIKQC